MAENRTPGMMTANAMPNQGIDPNAPVQQFWKWLSQLIQSTEDQRLERNGKPVPWQGAPGSNTPNPALAGAGPIANNPTPPNFGGVGQSSDTGPSGPPMPQPPMGPPQGPPPGQNPGTSIMEALSQGEGQDNAARAAAPGPSPAMKGLNQPGPTPGAAPAPAPSPAPGPAAGPAGSPPPGSPTRPSGGDYGNTEQENVFGLRDSDRPQDWASRTFNEGLKQFAGMDYNASKNPMANGPYESWLRQRYGTAVPMTGMLDALVSGSGPTQGGVGAMQNFIGGSPSSSGGYDLGKLKSLADMSSKVMGNGGQGADGLGLNAEQMGQIQAMNNGSNPQMARDLILGAYQAKYGNWGARQIAANLSSAAQEYENTHGQSAGGVPYFNYLLKAGGMG